MRSLSFPFCSTLWPSAQPPRERYVCVMHEQTMTWSTCFLVRKEPSTLNRNVEWHRPTQTQSNLLQATHQHSDLNSCKGLLRTFTDSRCLSTSVFRKNDWPAASVLEKAWRPISEEESAEPPSRVFKFPLSFSSAESAKADDLLPVVTTCWERDHDGYLKYTNWIFHWGHSSRRARGNWPVHSTTSSSPVPRTCSPYHQRKAALGIHIYQGEEAIPHWGEIIAGFRLWTGLFRAFLIWYTVSYKGWRLKFILYSQRRLFIS